MSDPNEEFAWWFNMFLLLWFLAFIWAMSKRKPKNQDNTPVRQGIESIDNIRRML